MLAAHACLAKHGIERLTADAVAERAGVSRRTLFNYFGSVEEALMAPARQTMDRLFAEVEGMPPGTPLLEVLREVLPRVFDEETFRQTASIWRASHDSPALKRTEAAVIDECVASGLEHVAGRYEATGQNPPDRLFVAGMTRSGLGAIETAVELWREQEEGLSEAASRELFLHLAGQALDDLRSGYTTCIRTTTEGRP